VPIHCVYCGCSQIDVLYMCCHVLLNCVHMSRYLSFPCTSALLLLLLLLLPYAFIVSQLLDRQLLLMQTEAASEHCVVHSTCAYTPLGTNSVSLGCFVLRIILCACFLCYNSAYCGCIMYTATLLCGYVRIDLLTICAHVPL
jgi:hypothetical protein